MGEIWAPEWRPIEQSPQFAHGMIHFCVDEWKLEKHDHIEDCAYYPDRECVKGSGKVHQTLMRYLRQVRESRGYDVDCYPPELAQSVFLPMENFARSMENMDYRDSVMKSTNFAVQEINALAQKFGKRYELKDLEKVVHSTNWMDLLTFTVTDVSDDAGDIVKTVQAMVYAPEDEDLKLEEWRFKPPPL